MNSSTF